MKRIISVFLALTLAAALAACGTAADTAKDTNDAASGASAAVSSGTESSATETAAAKTPVRIAGLKGPTSMGLVKLMEDNEAGNTANAYAFSLFGSADEVTPKLVQGELDMAAIPANLAGVLYNNTNGALQVLAVNTLGVLNIVEKGNDIGSMKDLKGRTVYATGKGSTPEYTLRYILKENGIDPDKDVTLEFKSEPTEVVSLLASGEDAAAMLPQPYVTAALGQVEGLRIAVDLTKAWEELGTDSQLITGVLVARSDFIEKNPEAVNRFLREYRDSVDWVLANTKDAAALIEKYGIAKAAVAEKALPFCNITFLAGEDMKAPLSGYLQVLFDQNPKAVGGKLPDDGFYYQEKN